MKRRLDVKQGRLGQEGGVWDFGAGVGGRLAVSQAQQPQLLGHGATTTPWVERLSHLQPNLKRRFGSNPVV
jgi:hypothetical protein